LPNWIKEAHQRASKSYYCLLLWISEKTVITLSRDSWGWIQVGLSGCGCASVPTSLQDPQPSCSGQRSFVHRAGKAWKNGLAGPLKWATEEREGASGAHSWGTRTISGCICKT